MVGADASELKECLLKGFLNRPKLGELYIASDEVARDFARRLGIGRNDECAILTSNALRAEDLPEQSGGPIQRRRTDQERHRAAQLGHGLLDDQAAVLEHADSIAYLFDVLEQVTSASCRNVG